MTNQEIAQEINNRIGNSPVPFDSVYSIALEIYQELGGEESQFDSVYSILLETLNVIDSGISAKVIDDSSISLTKTWSSSKIASELSDAGFKVEIVTELPSVGDPHTIYFILKQDSSIGDVYDEWMYIDGNWEKVGNTQIDLSDYAKISDVDASLSLKADKIYVDSSLALKADKASVDASLLLKQDALTAGQNIAIDASNNISALGYVWDASYGSTSTTYRQDVEDGGALVANVATGLAAVAEGYHTIASGNYGSHAEGSGTTASGPESHAEGNETEATGNYSHTEGGWTAATTYAAHAEGLDTQATAYAAHAEGRLTVASGNNSHSEGLNTIASGIGSHAEGYGGVNYKNIASGDGSHAEGIGTTALNKNEHAEGANNLSHKASNDFGNAGNTLHSIGDSDLMNVKHNAFEIMQNADMYIKGVGGYQGTDTKVQNASIMTVQEVINSKADAYEVATNAEIEALFA